MNDKRNNKELWKQRCEKYIELAKKGMHPTNIAAEFGVSIQTLYNWMKQNDDFKQAHEIGETMAEAQFHAVGWGMMNGKKGNSDVWRWYMLNRFHYLNEQNFRVGFEKPEGIKIEFVEPHKDNGND